ncbi:BREX-1 system adenine-specific DNA-methyltransferase PglX [Olivibacter sitiensis]|uniref:BREX-1 system adenine-specific DNA-methyltransferase PglX n=1 Tax=Olivibacter sitiensis TaxID=376470 RepID=UPI000400145A|nr:BREX-1 system adenine-specific DNA-methyltransferase PglX [Olivibacter sitiensis]
METNKIKSFAKEARLFLLDGVLQRLKYWGFSATGHNDQDLKSTQGGYIFRGQIYTDTSVPAKWKALKDRLKNEEAVKDIIEEAAYTWFNRLMAIKILEENGYLEPTLAYAEGIRTPLIVQHAKKGKHTLKNKGDQDLLLEYLREDKEEQAFGLLITDLCNRNKLLHDIFGRIDDYTEILLPQNILQKDGLLDLINSNAIASADFKEVELIGWLYQFYIADKKDEVFAGFKKNKKARAEDIPAATQIFTPKWIVKYMVENTVGKIYLDYEPTSSLKEEMKYLVQHEGDQESEAIISDITELTLIDPASGSGHILITGFELLFTMYREEGYTSKQAVARILKDNLFGLDIDDRAMQLARFAVLLKAAQFDADILNRGIIPHIYSFPEEKHFTSEELQLFLGHEGQQFTAELKEALQLLNQGKNIGSALKIELNQDAVSYIKKQHAAWSKKYGNAGLDIQQESIWNRLLPFLDVLLVLTRKYTAVVANPPYMTSNNFNTDLITYSQLSYPNSKSDLMSIFIDVSYNLLLENGLQGLITLHSWLFIDDFKLFRQDLLNRQQICSLIHLGRGVFGSDFGSTSFVLRKNNGNPNKEGIYFKLFDLGKISLVSNLVELEKRFLTNFRKTVQKQSDFLKIPKSTISPGLKNEIIELFSKFTISEIAKFKRGIGTSDNDRFIRYWAEVCSHRSSLYGKSVDAKWYPYNKGGEFRKWYGNHDHFINWENDGYEIRNFKNSKGKLKSRPQNIDLNFLPNISYTSLTISTTSVRYYPSGFINDQAGNFLVSEEKVLFNLIAYLNTKVASFIMEAKNPTINILVDDLNSLPYNMIENATILNKVKECIYISKKDWNSRETSWDFEKSPLLNSSSSLTQAYKVWEENVSQDFFQLHANEEELNRIFIDIYGLQEELTPEVALKDITILQEELDRKALEVLEATFRNHGKDTVSLPIDKAEVISQFISYAVGVFLGRYRLDKPGLNIAHPNPSEEEVAHYTFNGQVMEIDEDGILPLMGEDCVFPDDILVRTKALIHTIWGEESLTENINFIHDALGMDLHKWLVEKFWSYHTGMYKKKPIYWLFSSNVNKPQNAAFKVLIYMHRMDKYTVQKIQRNYLYPHQEHIKREIEKLSENESNLSKQEMKRMEQLRNWEIECRDYNEVLKGLANQQIEFDLDDGVSVNYAKFAVAVAKI